MLAIAISLLFGFVAFAVVAVIHASLVAGARRTRLILAELAAIDGVGHPPYGAGFTPGRVPRLHAQGIRPPRRAAA